MLGAAFGGGAGVWSGSGASTAPADQDSRAQVKQVVVSSLFLSTETGSCLAGLPIAAFHCLGLCPCADLVPSGAVNGQSLLRR